MPNSCVPNLQIVAFDGERLLGSGSLEEVAPALHSAAAEGAAGPIHVFDSRTSDLVELDLRGSLHDVVARAQAATIAAIPSDRSGEDSARDTTRTNPVRGPGRPRLGVVAREVTLLPRHWDWLAAQPGGASAALRRLVDQARSANSGRDRVRLAQESAYRFMSAMLGDAVGFEEAMRALFAGDRDRFTSLSDPWPTDLRSHARRLAAEAFST
ncbi:MAG: DUF2239 family protein [Gemmatimonadota bacterium]